MSNSWLKKNTFSDFHLFFDFLDRLNIGCDDKKQEIYISSCRLLILTSLIEGLPLTQLGRLRWSDLYTSTENGILLKEKNPFGKKILAMPEYLNTQFIKYHKLVYNPLVNTSFMSNNIFLSQTGKALDVKNIPNLLKEVLPLMKFKYANEFSVDSTLIMFGRRIIEIKGFNKQIIRYLRTHLKLRTELEVLEFLQMTKKGIEENEKRNGILTGII